MNIAEVLLLQPVLPKDLNEPSLISEKWHTFDADCVLTYVLPNFRYIYALSHLGLEDLLYAMCQEDFPQSSCGAISYVWNVSAFR